MKPQEIFDLESIKFICDSHRTLAVLVPYHVYRSMNHGALKAKPEGEV